MANKILTYILLFLVLCLLGLGIWGYFKYQKQAKALREVTAERDYCWTAPVKIDTIHDSIVISGGVIIKPIPIKIIVYDTVFVKLRESWYDSTYSGAGWRFRWRAFALGSLEEIGFSDFVIPKEIITYTKTVDTCLFKEPVKQSLSHLWLYIRPGMIVSPFQVSNVTTGLQYTRKNKWGIGAGIGYDWNINSPVADVTFLINLK